MYYVYLIRSLKYHDQIYVGSTKDLRRRITEHNHGLHASTRRYLPWKIVYYEAYQFEELARVREHRLKHHGNAMKELKRRIQFPISRSLRTLSKRLRKSSAGFTLIELLVVASVFSLLFLVGTTVFVSVQTSQRNILTRQRLTADGRYVLEEIARTMRLGTIDYTYYYPSGTSAGPTVPTNALAIRDQLNQTTCYYRSGDVLMEGATCTTGTALTPNDLRVEAFDVYLQPRSNPYLPPPTGVGDCRPTTGIFDSTRGVCRCDDVNDSTNMCWFDQRCHNSGTVVTPFFICQNAVTQPQATIVLRTQSREPGPGQQVIVTLQTSVTSRIYGQ